MTEEKEVIFECMVAIMRDLDAIGKNSKNESQGFKYRGIDAVYNALHPIMSKHGVFMTAEVVSKTREERTNAKGTVLAFTCLRMRYRFFATDGSNVATEAEGEGMDSGDKSSNKSMAVAHKYALLQAFCIPTEDMVDPDSQVHEVAAKDISRLTQPPSPPSPPSPPQTDSPYYLPMIFDKDRPVFVKWGLELIKYIMASPTEKQLNDIVKANATIIQQALNAAPKAHGSIVKAIESRKAELAKPKGKASDDLSEWLGQLDECKSPGAVDDLCDLGLQNIFPGDHPVWKERCAVKSAELF